LLLAGRHTHPGAETGHVLEGELELVIDGKPPMKIKAGESCQIPEGAVDDVTARDKPFKVLGVYAVKGRRAAGRASALSAILLASNCRLHAR
jgi:quercetin dioxygenase-like cupin family protein